MFVEDGAITRITITVLYRRGKRAHRAQVRHGARDGRRLQPARGRAVITRRLDTAQQGRTAIETPRITQTAAQLAAVVHITIPRTEIQSAMRDGITEAMAAVKAQGIGPAGPWFTHHLSMHPSTFDFEICVPVTAPVTSVGRVKPGTFDTVKVARTVYQGGYEGLGQAWGEFKA